jgi:hypothetical protein
MRKLLVAAMSFAFVATASVAMAQDSASPTTAGDVNAQVNQLNRKLKSSHIVADNGTQAVGGGFVAVHAPLTLSCPGATGTTCTVAVDQHMQIQAAAGTGNWAICTQVNGAFMDNPLCPFLGNPQVGVFEARAFAQARAATVPAGNFTVQTFIFTGGAGTRSIYELTYKVYKP